MPSSDSESDSDIDIYDDTWGPDPEQFAGSAKDEETYGSISTIMNMQLCIAVHDGDMCAVTALAHRGADMNFIVQDSSNHELKQSVLAAPTMEEQLKILEDHCMGKLPQHNTCSPSPDNLRYWECHLRSEYGHCTPLKIAVLREKIAMVKHLLNLGSCPQVKHPEEDHVLFFAIRSENRALVRTLLEGGADINVLDKRNSTVMYRAIMCQSVEILRDLIHRGANLEERTKKKLSSNGLYRISIGEAVRPRPMMLAASLWINDFELAVELVLAGAELERPLIAGVDYYEGMSRPLEDPKDLLSWAIDEIRSCGVLTAFCQLVIRAGVRVRTYHVDRARHWASSVVRHTASRFGARRAPPSRDEEDTPEEQDTIADPNFEMRRIVQEAFKRAPTLSDTCRKVIRRQLSNVHGPYDVRKIIAPIDFLPETVKSFLAMEDLTKDCGLASVSNNQFRLRAILGLPGLPAALHRVVQS